MNVAVFLVGMLLGFTCSRIARIIAARVRKNRWHEIERARHEEEGRALDEWCDYLKLENARMIDVVTEYSTGAILSYNVVFPGEPGYEDGTPIEKKYFKSGRSAVW